MKLLLDEHFAPLLAEQLRERGHDVVAAFEVGLRGSPDALVFRWAAANRRALLTNDAVDHSRIELAWRYDADDHFGLILTSDRTLPRGRNQLGALIDAVAAFLDDHPGEEALLRQVRWLSPGPDPPPR